MAHETLQLKKSIIDKGGGSSQVGCPFFVGLRSEWMKSGHGGEGVKKGQKWVDVLCTRSLREDFGKKIGPMRPPWGTSGSYLGSCSWNVFKNQWAWSSGSRGHSHTSCGSGKFHGRQPSFLISMNLLSSTFNPKISCWMPLSGSQWAIQLCKKLPTSGYSTWRFWRSFL